jgi:hypothetical protein
LLAFSSILLDVFSIVILVVARGLVLTLATGGQESVTKL